VYTRLQNILRSPGIDPIEKVLLKALAGRGFPRPQGKSKKPVKDLLDFNAVMQYIEKSDVDAEQAIAMAQALKKRELLNFNCTMPKHDQQDFKSSQGQRI